MCLICCVSASCFVLGWLVCICLFVWLVGVVCLWVCLWFVVWLFSSSRRLLVCLSCVGF